MLMRYLYEYLDLVLVYGWFILSLFLSIKNLPNGYEYRVCIIPMLLTDDFRYLFYIGKLFFMRILVDVVGYIIE